MEYQFAKRMSNVKASAIREILKATSDPKMISFAGGNPSAEAFPVEEIEKISADILTNEPISVLQYGITEGDQELIQAATHFFNRHEQVMKADDQMIITSGSQQIMEFAAKILCNEGDVVICENPSFLGALNAFKSLGAVLRGIEYKNGQLDLEALKQALQMEPKPKFMYLIPNFQNPTGMTMSLEVRKEILKLAKDNGVLILEDNPYGDLRFEGEAIPSIKSLDEDGLVIYAASLSKIIAPGMRVACCIAPKAIIQKMTVAKQASDVHSNLWAQKVMARYLQNYDMDAHIERIRMIYKQKCHLMLDEMKKHFHPDVQYTIPTGGMFIWVTLPESVDMLTFVKKALEKNVAVVPGNAFLDDDTKECHSFRMNYSTPTNEKIKEGVKILGEITYEMLSISS
ncbi:PLP-dependent aminotransferase family protein [Massilimicrobiota timonensis]|uniref:PLP-dependent aminotransferase family protein n=1 Tax=Massilimicrobiota timonensis TaxID=1776392 RepID=A0ABT7UHF2_9FIRM|nr:PLP-dependent aminotransferase family protein [Massilimicrobiota timonensis]MDM8195568.1 PLP-dependent aminotransferase family protein [Massilimicrobiota timonensis]